MNDRLIVDNLIITPPDGDPIRSVSLRVRQGEVVALTGPSGVGKTSVLRACLGLLPSNFHVTGSCELVCESTKVNLLTDATSVRGRVLVGWPQEAAAALDPKWTVLAAVRTSARDMGLSDASANDALMALDYPEHRVNARVSELSGGEARRAGIAAVVATGAPCVLLDEPTAGLSESGVVALLAVMRRHQAAGGSWLIATHDLAFARRIGARVVEMHQDEVVRSHAVRDVVPQPIRGDVLLQADGVTLMRQASTLIEDISLSLGMHRIAYLVGPSGAGKSTLCRVLSGEWTPTQGSVRLRGREHVTPTHRPTGSDRRLVHFTRQDSRLALDPWRTAEDLIREAAELSHLHDWHAAVDLAAFPRSLLRRRPGAMSGGERQRLVLARGYAAQPIVLLVDEALTGLDAKAKSAVIEGLGSWVREGERAALVVTHDQALVDARGWEGWRLVDGRVSVVGPTC